MRLENQTYSWVALSQNAKNKEQAINRMLTLKGQVETGMTQSNKVHAKEEVSPPKSPKRPTASGIDWSQGEAMSAKAFTSPAAS